MAPTRPSAPRGGAGGTKFRKGNSKSVVVRRFAQNLTCPPPPSGWLGLDPLGHRPLNHLWAEHRVLHADALPRGLGQAGREDPMRRKNPSQQTERQHAPARASGPLGIFITETTKIRYTTACPCSFSASGIKLFEWIRPTHVHMEKSNEGDTASLDHSAKRSHNQQRGCVEANTHSFSIY